MATTLYRWTPLEGFSRECVEHARRLREALDYAYSNREGFREWLEKMSERIEGLLLEANEQHMLEEIVGVVIAKMGQVLYATLRSLGEGREEALRRVREAVCGVAALGEMLIEEMDREGFLEASVGVIGGRGAPAKDEHRQ